MKNQNQTAKDPKALPNNMDEFIKRIHHIGKKEFGMGEQRAIHSIKFKNLDEEDPDVICDRNGCHPIG